MIIAATSSFLSNHEWILGRQRHFHTLKHWVLASNFGLYYCCYSMLGRKYGPPGTKKLVYFIDDMNMPEVDAYGTVQPHTLIRQHLDYQHWYACRLTLV